IETTNQETKIIVTIDGKPHTISESSLRRHLKLNDEEGISSLPDAELFKNLSLMGYNILPSHRVYNFSKVIFDGVMRNIDSLANPTKPHHTPSPQEHQSPQFDYSPQHDSLPLSHQTIIPKPIPHDLQALTKTLTPRRLTKRAIQIAQSTALSPDADELASLSRDDRHKKAFPTVSCLDAGQDRENIAKTSALSHESSPRVRSLDTDEGSMQQRLHELIELCTSLQRQQSQMADKIKDQDIEISGLKARVKSLEDKERRRVDKGTKKGSNDTEKMVNVLSLMEAANILSSGGATFSTASVSPGDVFPTAGVPTVSGSFPTVSAIFTTASVATPYTRRSRGITIRSLQPMRIPIIIAKDKGKEKVTKTKVPKKKKLQEQIDTQFAREMEEEFARENQRLSEQAVRDSDIARIHAEEELKLMIECLDRSNEFIAKHLSKYEQAKADLFVGEKIELISELVKYQDYLAEILKYQAQQSKPLSKKEQKKFYMAVLKSHAGWKTEHFRGMTLEHIKEKFIPISHTSRSELSQEQQFKGSKGVSEEELRGMMQLVPLEEVYIEALQQFDKKDLHKLWILVKKTFRIKQSTKDKEKELWVELKRLFEPDSKDQLWTYHQAFMHDPLDWKLYDTCGVHHVSTKKNQEIFIFIILLTVQDEELFEASSLDLGLGIKKSRYRRGAIDKTLFIKQDKKDIMLVQVYVDDIIFGSTKKSWCDEFEELMKNRFQMSCMGELTFFLGLQVKQKEDGIFISHDKYVAEILKKFNFLSVKTASTLIETKKPLVKDKEVDDVDVHLYRSMIGSLMYLTAFRPDIMFTVCACSRFQFTPKTSHIQAVKKIFRYLKGQPKLGLWYHKVSSFNLESYSDSDYTGANLDRKSTIEATLVKGRLLDVTTAKHRIEDFMYWFSHHTTNGYQFSMSNPHKELASPGAKGSCNEALAIPEQTAAGVNTPRCDEDSLRFLELMVFFVQFVLRKMELELLLFWSTTTFKIVNDKVRVQALIDAKMVTIKESSVRRTLRLDDEEVDYQLGDMSHYQDIYDNLSLSKKIFANMKRVGTGFFGVITPLFKNMLVPAAEEVAPKVPSPAPSPEHIILSPSNDPIPTAKDSLTLQELMDLCTRFSNKVLDLKSEVTDLKSSFTHKIKKLEDRVHKLEEENRILKEKSFKSTQMDTSAPVEDKDESFKQERMIANMDEDVEDTDEEEPAEVEEVLEVVKAAKLFTEVVTTAKPTTTTAAQVPKAKVHPKDKGKCILIEEPKPLKCQAQIEQDEAFARQLEAELNANINWNDVIEQVKKSERQNNEVMSEIRPPFEKHYNLNQAFLERVEEVVTAQEKEIKEEGNKIQGESLEQETTKKQRIDEEAEELKRHQEIVANDDDAVYTEATPLASKMFLLVEKKYPLTHFTLERMLNNVRLEVEEESEMSLELLRLVRRQLNKGGFLIGKGRGSGNSVKEKGPPIDDGLDVGNSGEASGSVTSNIGNSPSPPDNVPNSISFATKVKRNTSQKTVNFQTFLTPTGNGVDVHVPKESVSVVNERLNNTVYGFFLGKRATYLVVENYVKNTWGKFGLVKSMMIKGTHFFKFGSKEEMEAMLESGSWLSAIATKLGSPLMLDSYTAAMCIDS
nr:hypothetical protein [Tanacetum cinerariifolium]